MRYSQHEIEKYLETEFQSPGFFLEIGCWDGELISQSAYLERERGWTGVCVDPFPRNFEHRNCRVCAKAVSRDGRPREFIRVSIDRRYGGDVSYFSGFRDSIKTHWPLIQEFCDYEVLELETLTISQLYEQYFLPFYIDFLSVDTEGSELEIFQSIPFDLLSFRMIVFEHNEDCRVQQSIGDILTGNGYRLRESLRCDDIYIRSGDGS